MDSTKSPSVNESDAARTVFPNRSCRSISPLAAVSGPHHLLGVREPGNAPIQKIYISSHRTYNGLKTRTSRRALRVERVRRVELPTLCLASIRSSQLSYTRIEICLHD